MRLEIMVLLYFIFYKSGMNQKQYEKEIDDIIQNTCDSIDQEYEKLK